MLKKLGILTLIVFGLLGWVFYGIEHSTFKSNVELFPLANYPQDLNLWFRPNQPDWDTPLLDPAEQQKYFAHLKTHLFGTDKHSYSAWSQTYIQTLLTPEPQTQKTIFDGETRIIEGRIQNREKFFGINFRNHPAKFIKHIQDNMNIASLQNLQYQPSHRAILVQNALIRELPTSDPFFKDHQIAGEGTPFDYNRLASLYVGTPVYVLSTSKDKAWTFIVAPTCLGWVPSRAVQKVNRTFINTWQKAIGKKMGSIIKTSVSLISGRHHFETTAYLGTLLPIHSQHSDSVQLMVPVSVNHKIAIKTAVLPPEDVATVPLPITKHNLRKLLAESMGRPYGWGDMNFYHDCSSELRSLYMNFGILMPRNSYAQSRYIGTAVDLSTLSVEKRLEQIKKIGIPYLSLIYIPGHIMLYIGSYTVNGKELLMTYQDIWGLKPADNSKRVVIGGSVFFPLQARYPENSRMISLVDRSTVQLILMTPFQEPSSPPGLSRLLY